MVQVSSTRLRSAVAVISVRAWPRAAAAALATAAMVGAGLTAAPTANATDPLSATSTTVTLAQANATTTLTGVSVSGGNTGDILDVTVSTDVGTLTLPTHTNLTADYGYTFTGSTLSFSGTEADADADLPSLTLMSGATAGQTAHVDISAYVKQTNLVYSASNQHFYEYVPNTGITWSAAQTAAATQTYGGMPGYLATIPDDTVNTFVADNIQGDQDIWIGTAVDPNDHTYARVWKWTGGPLQGGLVADCTSLTGACDFATGTDGLNGDPYSHFASGEPNNQSGNEAWAVDNWNGTYGEWNDLPNNPGMEITGYLVEFGDQVVGNSTQPTATASAASSVGIYSVPDAPTGVSASTSGTSATVSWTPPVQDGGSAITGYAVTASPGGGTCTPSPVTATSCVFTGLTKGTAYTFTVTATNQYGTSSMSGQSPPVIPTTAPGVPTGLTATHGNGIATLSFTPPADNGGTPITGYQASTDGGTTWTTLVTAGTAPVTAVVHGLTNGTSYPVAVRAVNATGQSVPTTTVSTTPSTIPTVPLAPTVTTTGTSATVSWAAPNDGGSAITGYAVTASPGGGTCTPSPLTATTCVVTGLTKGVSYRFAVAAANANGLSAASGLSNPVTPTTAPGAPTDLAVVGGDGTAALSFTPPADAGGTPIIGYEVSTDGGSTWTALITAGAAPVTAVVTGLTNGTSYPMEVRAVNATGHSDPTTAVSAIPSTIPAVPLAPTVTTTGTSATVSWTAPDDGGSAITAYAVTASPGGGTCTPSPVTATTCVVTGLTKGTPYTFTVTAANANGLSAASALSNSVTPTTAPGAPTDLAVVGGNGIATLSFTAPADEGGTPVEGYQVSTDGGATWAPLLTTGTAPVTAVVNGLTNGTTYPVAVRAVNAVAFGAASAVSQVTVTAPIPPAPPPPPAPPASPPPPPAPTPGGLILHWAAPAQLGNPALTGYLITVFDRTTGKTVTIRVGDVLGATITGLVTGDQYTVTVVAVSAAATGTVSAPTKSVSALPMSKPSLQQAVLVPVRSNARMPVGCAVSTGRLDSCVVTVTARVGRHTVVVGHGRWTRTGSTGVRRPTVTVTLTPIGRMLAARVGGVTVTSSAAITVDGVPAVLHTSHRTRLVAAITVDHTPIYFPSTSATLTPAARAELSALRHQLGGVVTVVCVGYTDNRGSHRYNVALGLARARATCAYLLKGTGLHAVLRSSGPGHPAAGNNTPAGRRRNRRTELTLEY